MLKCIGGGGGAILVFFKKPLPSLRALPSGVPNAKYLAHQAPKINLHQAFQISKLLAWGYSALPNMRWYGQKMPKLLFLFYLLFLSPPNTNLSLSLSLSPSLFLFHSFADLTTLTTKPLSLPCHPPC